MVFPWTTFAWERQADEFACFLMSMMMNFEDKELKVVTKFKDLEDGHWS